jgi:maleylpyruvate isomerase
MSTGSDATAGSDLPHFAATIDATTRYLAALEDLTDAEVREPSILPGWSRAHVIAHLSRNADALTRVLHGARDGSPATMYDSDEQRDDDIEATAALGLRELREDASASWGRLLQAENELHAAHLEATFSRTAGAPPLPVRAVGKMRRTEVEVHHADLLIGYRPRDWPVDFSRDLVRRRQDELAEAGPSMVLSATDVEGLWKFGHGSGPDISGAVGDLAWWLVGRGDGAGLVSSTNELPRVERWR